ncbi:MAG: fatty acid kinase fatty acid binding subunit [Solirubrobacterales bacterium]|nr:fatty acid kinase fatty acid binding subunit [Solirubrobacterales bacterium]
MPSTAVVADTTSYLPRELLDKHDVKEVSLYVGLEGDQERESDITDLHAFYERLRVSDQTVTTSQPSVGDFISVYEPLLAEGKEIVSIHLSSGISGTCESAMQARERLTAEGRGGERIAVCDSRTGAGGMGLMILAAANAAENGANAAEALERANEARGQLKIWFAVDTLDYLRRGGRIGAARAWIGTTLKIKPILTLEEEITPIERVRTRRRAFERMVDYGRERHEAGADGWVVQHVQDLETAERLVEACKPMFGSDPVFTSEVGPVIGAHVGPGLLGIGGVPRSLLES